MLLVLAAAFFLPLFPFSVVLNLVLARVSSPGVRFVLLLAWPQLGVLLLHFAQMPVPSWFVAWALLSAGFYALRLLTVRELGRFAGLLATSALALTWALAAGDADLTALSLFVFWLGLPVALLALLDGYLYRRIGAAFAGLSAGLGHSVPRLSLMLAATLLAAVATPPFPGFFALLGLLHGLAGGALAAVLVVWLLWGWAAVRLLQGLVTGAPRQDGVPDVLPGNALLWTSALVIFTGAGIYLTGVSF